MHSGEGKQYKEDTGQPFDRDKTTLAVGNEISTPSDVGKKDYLDKKLPKELELPTSTDGRVYNTEEKYYEGSSKPGDLKEFADWYVTDLSFDAFQWNENQWDFKRDFDAKSLKVFKRPFNDPNK